jgi:16S rRNA (cytosine967-C5)-methyltransferase
VHAVLVRRRALDDPTLRAGDGALQPRDRAFARLIAATVLRRLGEIDAIVGGFLERPLPDDRGTLKAIVRCAAAQLLFLATPAHAAINIAVEQCRRDGAAAPFDGLVNAILRRVDTEGKARLPTLDGIALDIPEWLMARWRRTYGDAVARLIAEASLQEAPLDVSAKGDAAAVALRLGGRVLETGSVRLKSEGRIEQLPGFVEGEWWVQDAAAALPVRLLGPLAGLAVADLCAAPGGKSLLMAAAGAEVTAVDSSEERIGRLQQNLVRVGLRADLVVTDATSWAPGRQFDAVLIDAPCTATGTIRRHPDILRLKRAEDVGKLAEVQTRLLRSAVHLVKPGGVIVYCTCSLEPEEGEEQIGRFLAGTSTVVREAVSAADIAVPPQWMTARGELRTLPHFLPLEPPALSGMDGFYAVRLRRVG